MKKISCIILFLISLFVFSNKAYASVVINEFVPDSKPEWVEFYNASSSAQYLKSYWLDDDEDFNSDSGNSSKKSLTIINTTNSTYPYIEVDYFLNNSGDSIVLFDSSGNIVDKYTYSENPGDGVSIGRNPNNTGGFSLLESSTKGSANSNPQPSPSPSPSPSSSPSPSPSPSPLASPDESQGGSPSQAPVIHTLTQRSSSPPPTLQPAPFLENKPKQSPQVLGDNSDDTLQEKKKSNKPNTLSFIIIISGLVFLTAAAVPLARNYFATRQKTPKKDTINE